MARETGLSRGLGALLGAVPTVSPSRGGGTLPLSLMQAGGFQPRREIHREALDELAASIKANGLIQPIVVRPLSNQIPGGPRYEIVAGERRWQAAKLAGITHLYAEVAITQYGFYGQNTLDRLLPIWDLTNRQDWTICEDQQAGVSSRAYVPGPYSRIRERNVAHFLDWYLSELGA